LQIRIERNDAIFLFGLKVQDSTSFNTSSYENNFLAIDQEIVVNEKFKIGPRSWLVFEIKTSYASKISQSKHILKTQKRGTLNGKNFLEQSNASNSLISIQKLEVGYLFGRRFYEYVVYYSSKGEAEKPVEDSFMESKPIKLFEWVIYNYIIIYLYTTTPLDHSS
jgi:hypothetical protein